MTEQLAEPELFPITAAERVAKVRVLLEAQVDKAQARVDKAMAKVEHAEQELAEFDDAIAAVRAEGEAGE